MQSRQVGIVRRIVIMGIIVGALGVSSRSRALEVGVVSNSAPAGGSVDMCIYMSGSGGKVAGIQMNLHWDGSCVSITPGAGYEAQCSNLVGGKTLKTAIGTRPCNNDPSCMMAMLVSFSDVDPMQDQELFCCNFTVLGSPPKTSCPFTLTNVIAGESSGAKVANIQSVAGALTVSGAGSTGGAGGGVGMGGGGAPSVVVPAVGGAAAGGSTAGGTSGGGAVRAPAGVGAVPGLPAGVPSGQMPQVPEAVSGEPTPAAPAAAVETTPAAQRTTAVHATPTPRRTPAAATTTPAAKTPTAGAGTPSPGTPGAKTPTPKAAK